MRLGRWGGERLTGLLKLGLALRTGKAAARPFASVRRCSLDLLARRIFAALDRCSGSAAVSTGDAAFGLSWA